MAAKALPAQEVLLQLLSYDPETGKLLWKERGQEWFVDGYHSAETCAKRWNTRRAGNEALTALTAGYPSGTLLDVDVLAHRVIWKMVYGREPDQVDHINGVRNDNRLANLRDVSETLNKRNMCLPSHNTSGVIGISFDKSRQKWAAYITLDNRKQSLGRFAKLSEAIAARKAAEIAHGFHANHGRAA